MDESFCVTTSGKRIDPGASIIVDREVEVVTVVTLPSHHLTVTELVSEIVLTSLLNISQALAVSTVQPSPMPVPGLGQLSALMVSEVSTPRCCS